MGGEGKYRYKVRRMYEGYLDKEVYDGEVILYLNGPVSRFSTK